MKVTKTWIATNFDKFNREYFKGELPTPNFLCCNTYRMLGQCGAKNWRSMHPNFFIKISNYFDRTEHEFQNTLIHEMIHLYFQSRGEWRVKHGEKFQNMARSFDKYGWNIHTTEQGFEPKSKTNKIPTRIVMTFKDKQNNKMWVCGVADDKIKISRFLKSVSNNSRYENPKLFTANAERFGNLKVSQKRLGGKVISIKEYNDAWLPLLTEIKTYR